MITLKYKPIFDEKKGNYIHADTKIMIINYPPCLYAFGVEIYQNQ